jgi:XTP/dITP diphosphohydrolase
VRNKTILIATGNPGKQKEIQAMVTGLPIRLVGLRDMAAMPQPVEDGDTFAANARIKARYYARQTGLWTLAEDSGLQVDCLGGIPGVRSARFAGPQRNDPDNNARLVEMVRNVPENLRTARYRCVMILADGDCILAQSEGILEGVILTEPRGSNGFGYDPHFWLPALGKTAAELTTDQKNAVSHRGQALRAMRTTLQSLLARSSDA